MASLDSLRVRAYAARGAVQQSVDDTPVVLRMRYIGTGTVTSVVLTNSSTDTLVLTTSDGGTDSYSTAQTVGALAAAINADGIFEVKVLDALLSDTANDTMVAGTISAGTDGNGVVCYNLVADTSVLKAITATLSNARNFDSRPSGHRVIAQGLNYNVNVSAAEAGAVRIYQRLGGTETLVWSNISVDVTDTAILFANGEGKITSKDGAELIFRVQDATSVTDAANNYVRITGILE